MDIGLIGLGKMGANMRERLRRAGHTVVGFDRNPEVSDVASLEELVEKLPSPKVVWVMVPAGDPTRETITALGDLPAPATVTLGGTMGAAMAAALSPVFEHFCMARLASIELSTTDRARWDSLVQAAAETHAA